MRNLHKYYYKDYFGDLDFHYLLNNTDGPKDKIKRRNQTLTAEWVYANKDRSVKNKIENPAATEKFGKPLKISYPGLVTGVGINHEAKIEGEFKLGVHFDYTYGMPVVYGSSVKGALRSVFKMRDKKTEENLFFDEGFINDVNNKHNVGIAFEQFMQNLKSLEEDIFEGKSQKGNKSIYDRDIFFDAVLVNADPKGRILCSDSITPHGDNPLRNPTPITFLKIAPGCELEFRFKLVDTKDKNGNVIFSKVQKKALFEEILKTVGVGAKTNVGYGQFPVFRTFFMRKF